MIEENTTRMTAHAELPQAMGLTAVEAEARRRRGETNTAVDSTSRTYTTILRSNVFSFYNSILFVIGAALLSLGRYSDALISVGLGLINRSGACLWPGRASDEPRSNCRPACPVLHCDGSGVTRSRSSRTCVVRRCAPAATPQTPAAPAAPSMAADTAEPRRGSPVKAHAINVGYQQEAHGLQTNGWRQ
jgi:hypothetical protein